MYIELIECGEAAVVGRKIKKSEFKVKGKKSLYCLFGPVTHKYIRNIKEMSIADPAVDLTKA